MKIWIAGGLASLAALALQPRAHAREIVDPPPLSVSAGVGMADFTGSLGAHTNTGPGWNVRGAFDMSRNLGLEVGYQGAHNGIDDTRLPQSRSITTTGLDLDLKLTAPVMAPGNILIRPYVFGGLGGAYYGLSGSSAHYNSDSAVRIPLGLGGEVFVAPKVSVGARLGYEVNLASRISNTNGGNLLDLTGSVAVHY